MKCTVANSFTYQLHMIINLQYVHTALFLDIMRISVVISQTKVDTQREELQNYLENGYIFRIPTAKGKQKLDSGNSSEKGSTSTAANSSQANMNQHLHTNPFEDLRNHQEEATTSYSAHETNVEVNDTSDTKLQKIMRKNHDFQEVNIVENLSTHIQEDAKPPSDQTVDDPDHMECKRNK